MRWTVDIRHTDQGLKALVKPHMKFYILRFKKFTVSSLILAAARPRTGPSGLQDWNYFNKLTRFGSSSLFVEFKPPRNSEDMQASMIGTFSCVFDVSPRLLDPDCTYVWWNHFHFSISSFEMLHTGLGPRVSPQLGIQLCLVPKAQQGLSQLQKNFCVYCFTSFNFIPAS